MRRLVATLPLLLAPLVACEPAHIDLRLSMECEAPGAAAEAPVAAAAPQSCGELRLDCVDFVEARLYEVRDDGGLGDILRSRCLAIAELGRPEDMCALLGRSEAVGLLDELPGGRTVRFRLRALQVGDPAMGCNDDVPGAAVPLTIFNGFSDPLRVDGADHVAAIHVDTCGSCGGEAPSCEGVTCPNTPGACPDGSAPVLLPGACCAICPSTGSDDRDGDGVDDAVDDCPGVFNPDQADRDRNGLGDACDAVGVATGG